MILLSGYLGIKMHKKILNQFYWPKLKKYVNIVTFAKCVLNLTKKFLLSLWNLFQHLRNLLRDCVGSSKNKINKSIFAHNYVYFYLLPRSYFSQTYQLLRLLLNFSILLVFLLLFNQTKIQILCLDYFNK